MDVIIPDKCEGCGLCCINMDDSKWIEVNSYDALVLDQDFLQIGDIATFAMKQDSKGRCTCLDSDNRCSIYANRPSICRTVQRGDDVCRDSIRRFNKLFFGA